MSIDEMGYKYHSAVNNDTMEDVTYHFNYFILLVTGVLDSLAIHTKNHYKLFESESTRISQINISLRSKNGKKFLQALELKNPSLRKHIHDNADLINAPYLLRELIAHRESLHPHNFRINGSNANFFFVEERFSDYLRKLGDMQEKIDICTKFGICGRTFLNPYKFAKQITTLLSNFCNQYFQLLGYNNFLTKQKTDNNDFMTFQENNLGF